jgi:hypothetical protein
MMGHPLKVFKRIRSIQTQMNIVLKRLIKFDAGQIIQNYLTSHRNLTSLTA